MQEIIINSDVLEVFKEFARRINNENNIYPQEWLTSNRSEVEEDGDS